VRLWTLGFLGREGSSKTPLKYFCKKSMSKTFSRKIDKNFHVSFFSTSFCFIVFSNVSQRCEFKALQKTFCCFARNSCRKVFTKNRQKIQNRFFFLCFVFSRFWAFFGEGSSKTPPEKYRKKTDPGPFLASDPPIIWAFCCFFFWSPVTGSKEQRSAKRRRRPAPAWSTEPPAPRGAPFPPTAAPPPSQQLASQPGLAAAIPALP
jgi:hypothetical protein